MDTISNHTDAQTETLEELFDSLWERLRQGAVHRQSPFHTATIGTSSEHGVELRTVVLRQANEAARELLFHTDLRSTKVRDLQHNPTISWLFYEPATRLQLRASGVASIHHHDERARLRWERTSDWSRRCYLAPNPPGTILAQPVPNLLPELVRKRPSLAESERGYDNFCVIACEVNFLEWLHLRAQGHQRAQFHWDGRAWQKNWVAP